MHKAETTVYYYCNPKHLAHWPRCCSSINEDLGERRRGRGKTFGLLMMMMMMIKDKGEGNIKEARNNIRTEENESS